MEKQTKLDIILSLDDYQKTMGFEFNPWFSGFELIDKNWTRGAGLAEIETSIIIPTFNKEKIIASHLNSVINSLTTNAEIILVDDSSQDSTIEISRKLLSDSNMNYTILHSKTPIYETACDNVGFYLASGEYICDVQSDLIVSEKGFDRKLSSALDKYKLASVSGRCGHSWYQILSPVDRLKSHINRKSGYEQLFSKNRIVGHAGADIFEGNRKIDNSVYISDTNNRGPWMTTRGVINKIGYLDQNNFFLGNDDHDFNLRAVAGGGRCGYSNVVTFSNPADGSTRQERSGLNLEVFEWLVKNKKGTKLLHSKIVKSFNSRRPRHVE